jgi:hypothetical protein
LRISRDIQDIHQAALNRIAGGQLVELRIDDSIPRQAATEKLASDLAGLQSNESVQDIRQVASLVDIVESQPVELRSVVDPEQDLTTFQDICQTVPPDIVVNSQSVELRNEHSLVEKAESNMQELRQKASTVEQLSDCGPTEVRMVIEIQYIRQVASVVSEPDSLLPAELRKSVSFGSESIQDTCEVILAVNRPDNRFAELRNGQYSDMSDLINSQDGENWKNL